MHTSKTGGKTDRAFTKPTSLISNNQNGERIQIGWNGETETDKKDILILISTWHHVSRELGTTATFRWRIKQEHIGMAKRVQKIRQINLDQSMGGKKTGQLNVYACGMRTKK